MKYGDRIQQVVHPANPDPSCACGLSKCDPDWPYCDVTRLARASGLSASVEGSALSLSAQWIAEFDAIAAHHRREAKRRAGGEVSIEGGADTGHAMRASSGAIANPAGHKTPSDLDSPTPAPRCIANIATTKKRVAHQCRNRAKYGPHCALHATGHTPPDLEQFPAALVEQPDNLPFAHDD